MIPRLKQRRMSTHSTAPGIKASTARPRRSQITKVTPRTARNALVKG